MFRAVLFDFGGVLAEEGFRKGLEAIGSAQGVEGLFAAADRLIYETGYVTGSSGEREFWDALRRQTGIRGSDEQLRAEILQRFELRPEVLDIVDRTRAMGLLTAILSDQTNWLEQINARTPFYQHFDRIFNSYDMHKGKRDPSVFDDVCRALGIRPGEAVFVDDNPENTRRAGRRGMRTVLYVGADALERELTGILGRRAERKVP